MGVPLSWAKWGAPGWLGSLVCPAAYCQSPVAEGLNHSAAGRTPFVPSTR
jgi:hypothetical protein